MRKFLKFKKITGIINKFKKQKIRGFIFVICEKIAQM